MTKKLTGKKMRRFIRYRYCVGIGSTCAYGGDDSDGPPIRTDSKAARAPRPPHGLINRKYFLKEPLGPLGPGSTPLACLFTYQRPLMRNALTSQAKGNGKLGGYCACAIITTTLLRRWLPTPLAITGLCGYASPHVL
jgi:hypothetical protein